MSSSSTNPFLVLEPGPRRDLARDVGEGVLLGIRLLLAGVFGYAGFMKILSPVSFADALHGYDEFAASLIPWLAVSVGWLEWLTAAALLASRRPIGAMILAAGLSVAFAVVLVRVVLRGMTVPCGCFGSGNASVGWTDVVRAGVLVSFAMTGIGFCQRLPRPGPRR